MRANESPNVFVVSTYTAGRMGPSEPMIGPVEPGDMIRALTAPGCCGPLITTHFRGAHEVTTPVEVRGAEVGDAVVLRIERIRVTSLASATGVSFNKEGMFAEDGRRRCSHCGSLSPKSVVEGVGISCIRCSGCGEDITPIGFSEGYTMVFDEERTVGVSIDPEAAERVAQQASEYCSLPEKAEQNPILLLGLSSMVGTMARLRPFVGHIGTCCTVDMPDHLNAGDSALRLVGAQHQFGFIDEVAMRRHVTDAHLDSDALTEGAMLICPAKRNGAGVYFGDVHATQGGGELAGHTLDVSAEVTVEVVDVVKGLNLEGPLLLPVADFLPYVARPYTAEEIATGRKVASAYGIELEEDVGPIEVIGTGSTTNVATANAFDRAERLLGLSNAELRNRCTVTGGVQIGRLGTVRLGFLVPFSTLDRVGLGRHVRQQYGL